MVKITNPLGDIKTGKQGEAVYQRKYGEQTRRVLSPKRAIPSERQIEHRQLYRNALAWRKQLSLPNRRYLDGYCIANGIVDSYHIPLPWSRFALKLYLEAIKFVPFLELVVGETIYGEEKDNSKSASGAWDSLGQTTWGAQTFTPLADYPVGKVSLCLGKRINPGIVTVGIRDTDVSGHPTGPDLAVGTTNGNTLPVFGPVYWRDILLTPFDLLEGEKYAVVLRAPDAPAQNDLCWLKEADNTYYPRGNNESSYNSGVDWSAQNRDMNFSVWSADQVGEDTKAGTLHVKHPALLTVIQKRGALTVRGYDTLSSLDEEYLTKQVGLYVVVGDTVKATTICGIESEITIF